MASDLSPEDRRYFENLLAKADPFEDDDSEQDRYCTIKSIFDDPEGYEKHEARMMATVARNILNGRALRSGQQKEQHDD